MIICPDKCTFFLTPGLLKKNRGTTWEPTVLRLWQSLGKAPIFVGPGDHLGIVLIYIYIYMYVYIYIGI